MQEDLGIRAGTLFASDFQIERELGHGGMGAVYEAQQLSTGRKRAIKLMHASLGRDEDLRRRFVQEARVGSQIRSEHVVQVIAAGIDAEKGLPWLAMELLEGVDLAAHVASRGSLGLTEAGEIMKQLCHGLGAAHAAGIVHRDLKPENVFLARTHRDGAEITVKLLDLGIAKIVAEAQPSATAAVGTPLWMAPEQAGGEVSPATDVWALGLLAFWMLTGRSYWLAANDPAKASSVMAVLREIAVEPLESATDRAKRIGVKASLPAGFDAWFARCLVREPTARFCDAAEARDGFLKLMLGVAETALHVPAAIPASMPSAVQAGTMGTSRTGARNWPLLALLAGAVAAIALVVSRPRSGPSTAESVPVRASASASKEAVPAGPAPNPSASAATPKPKQVDQDDSDTVWRVPIGSSPSRGASEPLVTIVEFGNFQCPFSKGVERALRKLLDDFPDVRLIWKDDPLAIHSQAEEAAQLAREARVEKGDDAFWAAHDLLLDPEFKPSTANLLQLGKKLTLDGKTTGEILRTRAHVDGINVDLDLADDLVADGTPTFFVNGRRIRPTLSLDRLRAAVTEELAHAGELQRSGVPRKDIYDRVMEHGLGGMPLELRKFRLPSVRNPEVGNGNGKVFIVEFCDFNNFLCRLIQPTMDTLLAKYKNDLALIWINVHDAKSTEAREAAIAARLAYQDKGEETFKKMRGILLDAEQWEGGLSRSSLLRYGQSVGIDRKLLRSTLDDPSAHAELEQDMESAQIASIKSTPSFLFCGSELCANGGYFLRGGQAPRSFEKRIRLVLEANGGPLPVFAR
jgi:serine/threonine protein kinase